MRVRLLAMTAAILATSCAHSPTSSCLDASSVAVSVGDGATPVVTWAPACLVGSVSFEQLSGSARVPMFGSFDASNQIPSGRVYGGGQTPTTIFSPGYSYRVTVGVVVGGDAVATLGTQTFSR
jgi:hypothetical protein